MPSPPLVLALLEKHGNAAQVTTCLEAAGLEVLVANSFLKAKKLLASQPIDLVISDVHLENGGDVFDFLRWIKKSERSKAPFILFSLEPTPLAKYLADGVRTSARALGAAGYIEMEIFDGTVFLAYVLPVLAKAKKNR